MYLVTIFISDCAFYSNRSVSSYFYFSTIC